MTGFRADVTFFFLFIITTLSLLHQRLSFAWTLLTIYLFFDKTLITFCVALLTICMDNWIIYRRKCIIILIEKDFKASEVVFESTELN